MWVQSLGPEDSPGGGNGNPLQDLAWRIPWTEESGKLQSTVLQRFGQDCSNLTHTHTQYTHTHVLYNWSDIYNKNYYPNVKILKLPYKLFYLIIP